MNTKAKVYIERIIHLTRVISEVDHVHIVEGAKVERELTVAELLKECEPIKKVCINLNSEQVCRLMNGTLAPGIEVLGICSIGHYDFNVEVQGHETDLNTFSLNIN